MARYSALLATMIFLLAPLLAEPAFSQLDVRVGMSSSSVRMSIFSYGRSSWETGFTGGLFYSFPLSQRLRLRSGLVYSDRGGEYTDIVEHPDGSQAEVGKATYSAQYIDLPVLLHFSVFGPGSLRPVLIAGPSWGKILTSEYVQDRWESTDWISGGDFALVIGVGFESSGSGARWGVEILYRHALSGVANMLERDSVKFDGFSFLVGIGF